MITFSVCFIPSHTSCGRCAWGHNLRERDRPRYTPTTTFETFPFPWPPGKEPKRDPRVKAIAQAARELVQQRDAWLNPSGATEAELKKRTLTNLYNQRPTWLDLAHRKLDEAVFDAYGWPHDPSAPSAGQALSDEDILARLLALNLERDQGAKAITVRVSDKRRNSPRFFVCDDAYRIDKRRSRYIISVAKRFIGSCTVGLLPGTFSCSILRLLDW